jgi:hypothetical protein
VEARRPQQDRLKDLSRFVEIHERCGAGFELERSESTGEPLVIACRGCGARYRHAVSKSTPGRAKPAPTGASPSRPPLRLAEPPPARPSIGGVEAQPPSEVPARRPIPESRRTPESTTAEPTAMPRRKPGWLTVVTAAVGVVLVAALLKALVGGPSGDDGNSQPIRAATVPLLENTYSLRLPTGWSVSRTGAGALYQPKHDPEVHLQVFFQRVPAGLALMSHKTAALLRSRHDAARISQPTELRVAGRLPAIQVIATRPGGLEAGLVVRKGAYGYVLLRAETSDAPRWQRVLARRVEASFRPLLG